MVGGLADLTPGLRRAEARLGREVNVTSYSAAEFRKKAAAIFPFDSTDEALAYVEAGRAKGKVVVQVRPPEAVLFRR